MDVSFVYPQSPDFWHVFYLQDLVFLNISHCSLGNTSLPKSTQSTVVAMTYVDLSGNGITQMSTFSYQWPKLRWLDLSLNKLGPQLGEDWRGWVTAASIYRVSLSMEHFNKIR